MLTCMSQNNEELQRLRGFENICFLQKSEVGPGLIPNFFCGKSPQNTSKPVLIFWSSIQCVFCLYRPTLYTLLKVVNYYDFEYFVFECLGFQKTSLHGGWVGGVSSIQVSFGLFECF